MQDYIELEIYTIIINTMKKLFGLLALVLAVVSCQNDFDGTNVRGGEVAVTLNVAVPDDATRAAGSDSGIGAIGNIDLQNDYDIRYILEVYDALGNLAKSRIVNREGVSTSTSFDLRLVPGRDYRFVVWADFIPQNQEGNGDFHYNTTNIQSISLNGDQKANDESRDAYTCVHRVDNFKSGAIQIELKRPFAKLRIVTTDMNHLYSDLTSVTVAYTTPLYTTFNALTGDKGGLQNVAGTTKVVDLTKQDFVYSEQEYKKAGKMTLFADYFFGAQDDAIHFTLDAADATGMDIPEVYFNTNIPVQRNYLTTVMGPVLTDAANVTVEIKAAFENKENPNDPPYYQEAVTNGVELIKALLAGQEIIVLNDITVTAADLAAATRAGEEINPVLNLNGFTITIENNGTDALVDLNGGVLIVEGEGEIELSNPNSGALVKGDTYVTGVATVDAKVAVDENNQNAVKTGVEALAYVLANGGEFTMTENLEFEDILAITAKAPVVLDGNGKTLTSSAGRAINVSGAENVTIKNLNIVASGERAINVIQNSKNVTIENVTATAANYTVNVASSAPGEVVAIKNSTLNGLCTVNVASAGANVTVDGSIVNCNDNDTTEGESYAALCLNKEAVGGKIIATNSTINVTEGSDSTAGRNGAEDGVVTINGSDKDVVVTYAIITYTGSDYYYGFQTIAEAVEFAESGDKISLIRDVELTESLTISNDDNVVLDLNGKTITGRDSATGSFGLITNNGTLTVKNGTITLKAENNREWNAFSSVISNQPGGNLTVENVTLEHLGGTDMAYGIDNLTNGKGTSAIATVNEGAVVKSTYRAIRQFLNGIEATNELTVNAGAVVEGANKSIWMQDPNTNANTGKLVINEGATLNGDVYLFVCAGSTSWPVEVSIAASAVTGEVLTGNVPAGYEVVEENGVWVVKAYEFVANGLYKKDDKTYLVMNAEGLVALSKINIKGNEVVELGADINLTGVEFNGLKAFNSETPNTFDGKGYTVSNWTNESGASDLGFICSWVGTIKNVKFDNCHLKTSGRSAIVAANTYSNIDNVEVTNSSIEDSYWACGIVAGLYNSGSISNCTVTNSSVKSNGGTAAIVGVINESAGVRALTNCSVSGCTINNTGAYGAGYSAGALVGIFNVSGATYKFVNCSVADNTLEGKYVYEMYPADESANIVIE